ncbi:phospholipase D-like domain-containing protein [Variovorax rhizosphaerae]|uniref:Phospholipase D-like domain-containing protein n=1 Tax=Variovorax rhizosphaerae TaxID=1836200 RepID=A0ABU8WPS1_9BURK
MTDTDPERWFLDTLPFTRGNSVLALVDGSEFMAHLYDRFAAMQGDDTLCYTAWRASPTQKLRPDISALDSSLLRVLLDLVQRRVVVRLLAWYPPGTSSFVVRRYGTHNSENYAIVKQIRDAINARKVAGSAYLDQRLPALVASHHQKSMVLTVKGDAWAYVGGLDVSIDRWDTPAHTSPSERQVEKLDAWHDVHCAIQGPAVGAIADNFLERWNERRPPLRANPGDMPAPIKAAWPVPASGAGTLAVQRLRTLACNGTYDFRRGGEQSSREGINKAIDRAQYFVYIEDQYFWPCSTVERLAAAVRRGVYLFLVLARTYDADGLLRIAHCEMRKEALDAVRAAGAARVICCHLEQAARPTQIYVHSKLVIVDDRYVTIGSTNVGLRSQTTDSELNVAMVDSAVVDGVMGGSPVRVGRFARELRLRLWSEHLGLPAAQFDDPIASRSRWPTQRRGSRKVHHACFHAGDVPAADITLADWYQAMKALKELLGDARPWPNATPEEKTLVDVAMAVLEVTGAGGLITPNSDLALGPIWWTPRHGLRARLWEFLKTRIMNVETRCGRT